MSIAKHFLLVDGQFAKIVHDQFTNEIRIAMIRDDKLIRYQHQSAEKESLHGNIYSGKVVKHYKSLNAAFVDIGISRHGFLRNYKTHQNLFQVTKDPKGKKCPSLTSDISLTGRYTIFYPNGKPSKSQLPIENCQILLKENSKNAKHEDILADARHLIETWELIKNKSKKSANPCLLYRDNDAIINAVKNMHYGGRIIVEGREVYSKVAKIAAEFAPDLIIKNHKGKRSLFEHFKIEDRILTLHDQEVQLESGGRIVINQTEAMITIDVNSGNSKEHAYTINKQAASTAAEQIILRNLSGLIIIDFIDMYDSEKQQKIYEILSNALQDSSKIQISAMSNTGTIEIARQRIMPSISENVSVMCDKCNGYGTVRSVSCATFSLLRYIKSYLSKNTAKTLQVRAPQGVVLYIMNYEKNRIDEIERRFKVKVLICVGEEIEIL